MSLGCSIYGQMPGFPTEMPFPGGCPVPNACDSMSQGNCPIEAGKSYIYELGMDIGYTFPRVNKSFPWDLNQRPSDCKSSPLPLLYFAQRKVGKK